MAQYASEHKTKEQPSKQYFKQTKLKDIIMEYPFSKKNPKQSDIDKGEAILSWITYVLMLIVGRNGTQESVCRFCVWLTEPRSNSTMVASASRQTSLHHWRKVYGSLSGE